MDNNDRKLIEELYIIEVGYNELRSLCSNNRYEVLFNIDIDLNDKIGCKVNKNAIKHPVIYITSKFNLIGSYHLNLN